MRQGGPEAYATSHAACAVHGPVADVARHHGAAAQAVAKDLAGHGWQAARAALRRDRQGRGEGLAWVRHSRVWRGRRAGQQRGDLPDEAFVDMPDELFHKTIDVNLRSVYLMTKTAVRTMIDRGRGGRIVNATSIEALHPFDGGTGPLRRLEARRLGFTKNLALELAPHRIGAVAVVERQTGA